MAIAYDAVSVGLEIGVTEITVAHTCTGSNLVLIVGVMEINAAAEVCTGVTYDGAALTKIDSVRAPPAERWVSLWYKINPSTGANNIVASFSEETNTRVQGVSYTGCKQSGVPDASSTDTSSATTTHNHALASILNNCWHIFFVKNTSGNNIAGAGTTLRGVASDSNIMDSNSAKTPAGSVTLQATYGSNTGWGSVMMTLAPTVAGIGAYAQILNPWGINEYGGQIG